MVRQVVCRGVTLGRRGIPVVSTNTKNPSPGGTPGRTQHIGAPHTDARNSQRRTMLDTYFGTEFIMYTVSRSMMEYLVYLLPRIEPP